MKERIKRKKRVIKRNKRTRRQVKRSYPLRPRVSW